MRDVVIHTSDGCQYCHVAKGYMDENNVKYTEENISQDQEVGKEPMRRGHMGAPVTIISDEETAGFNQVKSKEALGL